MSKRKMKPLDVVAIVLLIIGGLNWGLVAFGFDLVKFLLGYGFLTKLIYALVGISALYSIWTFIKLGVKR